MSATTSGTGASPTTAGSSRAAVLVAANDIEVREIELAPLADGWARVCVSFSGIWGSDFPIIAGSHPRVTRPLIMGHEISGVIEDPGTGSIRAETRVAVNPLIECGECGACRQGLFHVCRSLRLRGIDVDRSMTELTDVPISSLSAFDEGVDPHSAALAEPLAVAVHSVHRSGPVAGESVLSSVPARSGCSLLSSLVTRGRAPSHWSNPARAAGQWQRSSAFWSQHLTTFTRRTNSATTMLLLSCSIAPGIHRSHRSSLTSLPCAAAWSSWRFTREGPNSTSTNSVLPNRRSSECFAEQTVIGIRAYERADFEESVALINSGALRLSELPISEYPLERVQEAFAEARSADGAVKVLIKSPTTTTQRT